MCIQCTHLRGITVLRPIQSLLSVCSMRRGTTGSNSRAMLAVRASAYGIRSPGDSRVKCSRIRISLGLLDGNFWKAEGNGTNRWNYFLSSPFFFGSLNWFEPNLLKHHTSGKPLWFKKKLNLHWCHTLTLIKKWHSSYKSQHKAQRNWGGLKGQAPHHCWCLLIVVLTQSILHHHALGSRAAIFLFWPTFPAQN